MKARGISRHEVVVDGIDLHSSIGDGESEEPTDSLPKGLGIAGVGVVINRHVWKVGCLAACIENAQMIVLNILAVLFKLRVVGIGIPFQMCSEHGSHVAEYVQHGHRTGADIMHQQSVSEVLAAVDHVRHAVDLPDRIRQKPVVSDRLFLDMGPQRLEQRLQTGDGEALDGGSCQVVLQRVANGLFFPMCPMSIGNQHREAKLQWIVADLVAYRGGDAIEHRTPRGAGAEIMEAGTDSHLLAGFFTKSAARVGKVNRLAIDMQHVGQVDLFACGKHAGNGTNEHVQQRGPCMSGTDNKDDGSQITSPLLHAAWCCLRDARYRLAIEVMSILHHPETRRPCIIGFYDHKVRQHCLLPFCVTRCDGAACYGSRSGEKPGGAY